MRIRCEPGLCVCATPSPAAGAHLQNALPLRPGRPALQRQQEGVTQQVTPFKPRTVLIFLRIFRRCVTPAAALGNQNACSDFEPTVQGTGFSVVVLQKKAFESF